ncbi:MAG: hypothetical protein GWP03_01885 [Proteobacteria bacterium]|nr:hypothetical protein [Pseudomonadota bacterium]
MIIYTTNGENRTKFFNNVKFEMDSINFTSEFAEMFEDTLFLLSDSITGRDKGNVYETDRMYFYPKSSIAKFIGNNRFVIRGNILKGDSFILDMTDSTMEMRGNVGFVSQNDSIAIESGSGEIINRENYSRFFDNPLLQIRGDSDTIFVRSDTVIFDGDSVARFVNNLDIRVKQGDIKGKNGTFFLKKNNGIVTGDPRYVSKEIDIKGDTMKIVSDGGDRSILFYNHAEMEYNKRDSIRVKSDSIEIDIEKDSIKTIKAFGEVDGSYRRTER